MSCVDSNDSPGASRSKLVQNTGMFARALLILWIAAVGACSDGASDRCKEMCKRETECAEEQSTNRNLKYDQGECVSACVGLERDPQGKQSVDKHYECFKKSSSCGELFECRR
jgi:hypothetical protein